MYYYRLAGASDEDRDVVYFFVIEKAREFDEGFVNLIVQRSYPDAYIISDQPLSSTDIEPVSKEDVLALEKAVRLYVYKQNDTPALSTEILNLVLNFDLRHVRTVDQDFETEDYVRPVLAPEEKPVLFVFPGSIYPRMLGSHQRAITVLLMLLEAERDVDIVFTAGNNCVRKKIRPILQLLTANATPYDNKNNYFPQHPRLNNHVSARMARVAGWTKSELGRQIYGKVTRDLKRVLADLTSQKKYSHVVINYVWMLPCRSAIKGGPKIICDTHDVQFFRKPETTAQDKNLEIRLLSRCDKVVAISHRDHEILAEHLPDEKLETVVSPFNYLGRYSRSPESGRLQFGFLGHKMDANYQALKKVVEEWWPAVLDFSPDSKFYIAGSICDHPEVKKLVFLRAQISLLGFVDSLNAFYRNVDVLLSPVEVKGGLNFKNAEALATRKLLVTNQAGADALKPLVVPFTCETGEDVVDLLSRYELEDPVVVSALKEMQDQFDAEFSGSSVQEDLRRVMS